MESLVVDIMPAKSGWAGTPESVMQHNEELAAAMAQSDKYKEEKEELLKVGQSLRESLEKHQTVNAKLKEVVDALKEKLDEVNLTNAKLLYTNRILRKSSLNERQKNKIVEALSNAGSVNEAKVLYETLQNAVGSSRKEGPQSLSEAVSRPSTMLPRRKVQDNDSNSFTDRMKMLAGIKINLIGGFPSILQKLTEGIVDRDLAKEGAALQSSGRPPAFLRVFPTTVSVRR